MPQDGISEYTAPDVGQRRSCPENLRIRAPLIRSTHATNLTSFMVASARLMTLSMFDSDALE